MMSKVWGERAYKNAVFCHVFCIFGLLRKIKKTLGRRNQQTTTCALRGFSSTLEVLRSVTSARNFLRTV